MKFSTKPNRRETILGYIYLILYLAVLPWLISAALRRLAPGLDAAQSNFIYFLVNFAATTVIFRKYLHRSLQDSVKVPSRTLWCAILGFLGNRILSSLLAAAILKVYPDFVNVNDSSINQLVQQNRQLMVIGVVVLAPVAEELLFRGLIFRVLYDRRPLLAHLVSIAVFSAIHISSYVGYYEPELLLLCLLQYLPAALCLNFAYRYSGSIVAPILMHMLSNLLAFSAMR